MLVINKWEIHVRTWLVVSPVFLIISAIMFQCVYNKFTTDIKHRAISLRVHASSAVVPVLICRGHQIQFLKGYHQTTLPLWFVSNLHGNFKQKDFQGICLLGP